MTILPPPSPSKNNNKIDMFVEIGVVNIARSKKSERWDVEGEKELFARKIVSVILTDWRLKTKEWSGRSRALSWQVGSITTC